MKIEIKAIRTYSLPAVAALLLACVFGSGGAQAATPGQYVGVNLFGPSPYAIEFPFLNLMKSAGAGNYPTLPWRTSTNSTLDTHEQPYLQVDSDGYVTSLNASPTPPGGQQFTFVQTFAVFPPGKPPGATYYYPPGPYTLQFQGAGTIVLAGDPTSLASSTSGISISGNTIVSTMSPGNTATVTFSVGSTSSNGITFEITALPSSTNYIKAVSIVQSAYQSAYAAGELFNPAFKASLAPYSRLRFMAWGQTNYLDYGVQFTSNLSTGATSGTMAHLNTTGPSYTTWPFPTGTYNFIFGTGQVIAVQCTAGSAALTWSTPLSGSMTTTIQAFYSPIESWAQRPLLSNVTWASLGVPIEAMVQLCNEVGADCWINIPGTAQAVSGSSGYATSLAQLLYNGAGANLTGSPLTGFSGLNSGNKAYIEYTNEYWNSVFEQFHLSEVFGTYLWNNGIEWFGVQLAGIGDAFYSAYGATPFASRVVITASKEAGDSYWLTYIMNAPQWVAQGNTAPYLHHIGAIHTGGYFGMDWSMSNADVATLQGFTAAQQVTAYFDLAYSNVSNGHTFSSMPSGGYIPAICSQIAGDISNVAGQPWGALPRTVYEGGTSNTYPGGGSESTWATMVTSASRDARSAYIYYDPTHQLNATHTGYFTDCAAAVAATAVGANFNINIFQDVSSLPGYNGSNWEVLESTMQAISPTSSAPPKYQGILAYAEA
jgi:hypothetical protein